MSKTARHPKNLELKVAICGTGIAQSTIARRARITPVRLSKIVTGLVVPTPRERRDLARQLARLESELFQNI